MNTQSGGAGTGTVIAIALGTALVPLNSTMIAVALPEIAEDLDVSSGTTSVLVFVYLITMFVGQPMAGRLGDRFGSRRMLVLGMLGLAGASLLGAFVNSFSTLVVARALQAVFAATLTPNAQAILRGVSAPERTGRNFGLMGSVLGGGAAAGPLVGGIVIAAGGWQAVFLVNIPVIGLALWAVARTVPRDSTRPVGGSGHQGGQERIFNRAFGAAFLCQATTTLALYSLLLLVPMLLDQRGWSSFETGVAMTAFTVGNLVMGPLGGRLGDDLGRRKPARLGISVAALAAGTLAVSGPDVNAVVLVSSITVFGLGIGFAVPSIMTAAIESVPEERTATAGGIFQTARYSGSIPASLAFMFVVGDGASRAGTILVIAAVAALLAIGASGWLPSLAERDRPQLSRDDT